MRNRNRNKNKQARISAGDQVAIAKAQALKAVAEAFGQSNKGPSAPSADWNDAGSANYIGSTAPSINIDTAHRGASQISRGLLNWQVSAPVDPNLETVYDLPALRARSGDLVRNNPIAHAAVNLPTLNVVGDGLTVHPTINRDILSMTDEEADAWERKVKTLFDLTAASTDLDMRGVETFYGLQKLAFRSKLERGETFVTLPINKRAGTLCDLRVHLIEGDRVSNPQLTYDQLWRIAGIETDIDGFPIAYWIETTPTWLNVVRTWERVLAFGEKTGRPNLLHIYEQQRIGDKRGVPYLSPVIETLKQVSRYSEAELMAAVISAMFTVFIKTLTGDDDGDITRGAIPENFLPAGNPGPNPSVPPMGPAMPNLALGNGAIMSLAEGEDVQIADPKRPNALYEPFVQAHIRQIGMALGIPYEVLTQHFNSSYSASRAALLEAWRMYDERRDWFAKAFCQPIYEEWLAEQVLKGNIAAPGFFSSELIRRAYCGAEWIGPQPGQLDPVKETNAATMRVNAGFSTIERESRGLNGTNYERNFNQRAKEEKLRKSLELDFTTNINPITGADDGEEDEEEDESDPPLKNPSPKPQTTPKAKEGISAKLRRNIQAILRHI